MSWNYRIVKTSGGYEIFEVYYKTSKKGKCKIEATSMDEISPYGESPEELKEDLKMMLEAFDRPILNQKKLDKMFKKREKKLKLRGGVRPFGKFNIVV